MNREQLIAQLARRDVEHHCARRDPLDDGPQRVVAVGRGAGVPAVEGRDDEDLGARRLGVCGRCEEDEQENREETWHGTRLVTWLVTWLLTDWRPLG